MVAAVVLMVCYLRIAGTVPVISDGAGNALQAWDMLHGNLLLHGWWVTDVSFYTTELPQYALVEAAAGLRPEVVHICAAMTYTLLVLLAAYVARGRARGAEGVVRAVLAAGVMLAPEPGGAVQILLSSPDHVGTAVPVLLLLLLLDRGRPSWWQPVAAFVVLSVAIVGDPLTEVIGVLPLAVLCLARIASAAAAPSGPAALAVVRDLPRLRRRRRGCGGRGGEAADRRAARVLHQPGKLGPGLAERGAGEHPDGGAQLPQPVRRGCRERTGRAAAGLRRRPPCGGGPGARGPGAGGRAPGALALVAGAGGGPGRRGDGVGRGSG